MLIESLHLFIPTVDPSSVEVFDVDDVVFTAVIVGAVVIVGTVVVVGVVVVVVVVDVVVVTSESHI